MWGLPQSLTQDLLISFAYDWRKDYLSSSERYLQNLLATIDHLYGQNDYQVFLIGHSMGGLVARAYLETLGNPLGKPADKWYGKIKSLITLGTPHLGAPLAVDAISGSIDKLLGFIKLMHPDVNIPNNFGHLAQDLVNSQYCQSAYELLPPPSSVSSATSQTQFIKAIGSSYNIFDLSSNGNGRNVYQWLIDKGMSLSNWQNARNFLISLNYTGSVQASQSALPAYYCVYGSGCKIKGVPVTCTSLAWDTFNLTDMTGDGDMIVPVWSAQFSGRKVAGSYQASGVDHLQLPGDENVLQQVAKWVGAGSGLSDSSLSSDVTMDELIMV
jgi:pimeloyl-ACP methyl ester carboxylesterase